MLGKGVQSPILWFLLRSLLLIDSCFESEAKEDHIEGAKELVMEQYAEEPAAKSNLNQQWTTELAPIDKSNDNSLTGFECNICLDFVQDPVVTFCGHLYCWPCIYKWTHFKSVPSETSEHQQPQCPVCKAEVSKETLIPLYGRGLTSPKSSNGRAPQFGIAIPQRPPSPRCGGHLQTIARPPTGSRAVPQLHHPRPPADQHQSNQHSISDGNMAAPTLSLGETSTNVIHPMVGMFGDIIFGRIFGISETALYSYTNTYCLAGSNSPRMRRHLMKVERSLSRVCFFLCCCMIVCLLSF